MKKTRKAIAIILSSLLLLSIFIAVLLTAHKNTDKGENKSEATIVDIHPAIDRIEEAVPQKYFGGIYLSESGEVIVNVTDPEASKIDDLISEISAEYENVGISYKKVDKSLRKLNVAKEKLTPYMKDYNMASLGIDIKENKLSIELFRETEGIEALVEKFLDLDHTTIEILPEGYEIRLTTEG